MKSLVHSFIALLIFSVFVNAQYPIDSTTLEVTYTDVVEINGQSKAELYQKTKNWITATLKSSDNMIQLDDANMNRISSTSTIVLEDIPFPMGMNQFAKAYLNFKVIIQIKDGKVKYSITNFLLAYKPAVYDVTETPLEKIKVPHSSWAEGKKRHKRHKEFEQNIFNTIDPTIKELIKKYVTSLKKVEDNNW